MVLDRIKGAVLDRFARLLFAPPECKVMSDPKPNQQTLKPLTPRPASLQSIPQPVNTTGPGTPYTVSTHNQRSEQEINRQFWDAVGSESAEHALIWHIYNDESTKLDAATTDGLNRGIDVLLVFTGLFSAVLTTFIIQSYQQMLPNASDLTNTLLLQLITDLRESATLGIESSTITLPSISGEEFVPSGFELQWVNGLWFAALSCSLSTALISMLFKQWIQAVPNVSGSPRYRARQRQRRHIQLKQWRVSTVISALPLLLHTALLLFFAGIIVLLWSGDIAIMAATFGIVALAYTFYVGSMWLSLAYPDCPYQHPISEHLRRWFSAKPNIRSPNDPETGTNSEHMSSKRRPMAPCTVDQDHFIDASSLLWLLEHCSNEEAVAASLQAIGGFPKEFTAFRILRDAGAIPMVMQHFSQCFHRDVSSDLQWHVADAEKAEKYCRAWVRLTHGTTISWPRNLQAPLKALKEYHDLHVSAIASCVIALNSLESREPQIFLINLLETFANGELNLDDLTQSWLLDTFLECALSWELRTAVIKDIIQRSVPLLLRVLQRSKARLEANNSGTTIPFILQFLIKGKMPDNSTFSDTESTQIFRQTMVPIFTAIIYHPNHYGIEGALLDFIIIEFSQLVAPYFTRASLSAGIKTTAQQGLSKLYLEGRITNGLLPDSVLADILHIMYPPSSITPEQKPRFTKILLRTLAESVDRTVQIKCIRLLEALLRDCDTSTIRAFTEENGLATFLRLSNVGDADNRRLQTDCIRTLCIFIQSASTSYLNSKVLRPLHSLSIERHLDEIFSSNFFKTILLFVGSQHGWLAEIADIWLPSLLQLCRIRPQEEIWHKTETAFRDFADIHIHEEGSEYMMDDLDQMSDILKPRN